MIAEEQQQQHADTNRGNRFGNDSRIDEVLEWVDSQQVHRQPQHQQRGTAQHLGIRRRRFTRRQQPQPEPAEVSDRGQRSQGRRQVHEPGKPSPAIARQALDPLITTTGQWVL